MRIERSQASVVCVDYQERILPAMFGEEELLHNSERLLEGVRVLGLPIVLTQQYTKGLGTTVARITEAAGTQEYVEKLSFSACHQLVGRLRPASEAPFVILCGIESHICVLQTAMELREAGYVPYLVSDCIASRRREDYEAALIRAQQEGVLITSYEAILFELLGEAGTPEAKAIQRIVR